MNVTMVRGGRSGFSRVWDTLREPRIVTATMVVIYVAFLADAALLIAAPSPMPPSRPRPTM